MPDAIIHIAVLMWIASRIALRTNAKFVSNAVILIALWIVLDAKIVTANIANVIF